MAFKLGSTGLVVEEDSSQFVSFVDSVLRGIGQVFLQNNSYTGLLFLMGIFCNSILFGAAVLVGTIVSTVTAIAFGAKKDQVAIGLFGFNGALVGIALVNFLQPDGLTWGYVVLASACSSVVMTAAMRLLGIWKMPTLTSPFVLTTLCFLLVSPRFGGLPAPVAVVEGSVTASTILEGFFKGVAQVFFQDNIITGIFFIAGLLASSRRACLMAALGSMIGILAGWGLGAAEGAIRSGGFGFNPVLTAVAIGGLFTVLNMANMIYILFAIVATVITSIAVSAAFAPLGMPALTLPFVLAAWIFILGNPFKKS